MSSRLLLLPAALALLAGCETVDPVSGSVDPSFGETAHILSEHAEIQLSASRERSENCGPYASGGKVHSAEYSSV